MRDEESPRARRDRAEEIVDSRGRPRVDLDVAGAGALAHVAPEQFVAAVLLRGGDDLVTRPQVERAGDHVDGHRRVRDEHEVVRTRANVGSKPLARRADQLREAAPQAEEFHGLALELELEALVLREDRPRTSAERAMVQEDDLRVE